MIIVSGKKEVKVNDEVRNTQLNLFNTTPLIDDKDIEFTIGKKINKINCISDSFESKETVKEKNLFLKETFNELKNESDLHEESFFNKNKIIHNCDNHIDISEINRYALDSSSNLKIENSRNINNK